MEVTPKTILIRYYNAPREAVRMWPGKVLSVLSAFGKPDDISLLISLGCKLTKGCLLSAALAGNIDNVSHLCRLGVPITRETLFHPIVREQKEHFSIIARELQKRMLEDNTCEDITPAA